MRDRVSLADVAANEDNSFVDGPFGSNLKSTEYTSSGVRLIQLQNIGEGYWDDRNLKFITSAKFRTLTRHGAKPGDIAIAKMAEPVARACIIPPVAGQFVVVADCIKLTPDRSRFDTAFLVAAINSQETRLEAELKSTGTTRRRINLSTLKTVSVFAPPLPEQQRIAEILDALDEAIRKTEQVIAKLQQMKQGLLHDLLTRGINEHGELRDPQRHPEQFKDSPLGRIPKEWEVRRLVDLLANVDPAMRSGPFGSALLKQELVSSGVPLLGIENVHVEHFIGDFTRFVTPKKALELSRYLVRPRDVMITIMGTVGRCALVPDGMERALSSKHVWTITFDQAVYSPFLACVQLNHARWALEHLGRDEQGGIMSAIRAETLRTLRLPTPPFHEQQMIEGVLLEHYRRISTESVSLDKLRLLKQGLMDDLLTGRVRVNVQEAAE